MESASDALFASVAPSRRPAMDGVHPRRLPRLLRSRGFALGLWAAGCSALATGCEHASPLVRQDMPAAQAQPLGTPPPDHAVTQAAYHPDADHAAVVPKQVPINLDTVLRLAEHQNPQTGLA